MKNDIEEQIGVHITYKEDAQSWNKLKNFLISFIIDSNISESISENGENISRE